MRINPVGLLIAPLEELLNSIGMGYIIPIANIAIAFIVAAIAVKLVKKLLMAFAKRQAARSAPHTARRIETSMTMLAGMMKYVFYFIAVAVAIGELGLSGAMNSMLAAAGIGTLAIGIGAQSLIGDVVTGALMLFEDQIAVGDYVEIAGVTGTVEELTLRTLTLRGYKGEKHIIPNGQIKTVVNYSRDDYLAVVELEISNEANSDRALDIMLRSMLSVHDALEDDAKTLPEKVGIVGVSRNSVTLRVCMKADIMNQWHIQRETIRLARIEFEREGIAAPHDRLLVMEGTHDRPV